MMQYKYYLNIGSSKIEVSPLNFLKTSLVDKKQRGAIFYRRAFNGSLCFYNGSPTFLDFELLAVSGTVSPCTDLIFEIEQRDSGANTYHNYWTGHFSINRGTFDLDRCLYCVTPQPYDAYAAFDNFGDKQYDIYLAGGPAHNIVTQTIDPAQEYVRNFWLITVIEYLVDKIVPGATVTSSFLNNATNPVTLDINKYQHLTLAQKSDIKRPDSSNPVTSGNMSFNELMAMLKIFNLYWAFDGTTLRVEHYDYWSSAEGLDLRTQPLAVKSNKYDFISDLPTYERFFFMEAENTNYTEHVISYDPTCISPGTSVEMSFPVTTDLDFIYNSVNGIAGRVESSISDEGWVILANQEQGGVNYVYWGTAYENATASNNYVCSWSYLLRTLFMHGRVLISGEINGLSVDFISTIKTKKQNVKAIVCWADGYKPEDNITTELGEEYLGGQRGTVETATIHPDGLVEFSLLYGEGDNTTPSVIPKYKVIHCVINLPRHIYTHLSEPNTVDTYYSVLFDDGLGTEECIEILIPAGNTYQQDLTVTEHTVVSGIYTGDSSLTGWIFTYNENDAWTEVVDCGSPPPPPGAPPAAPVLVGATQTDQWGCVTVGTWNEPATATYYEVWRSIDSGAYEWVATLPAGWVDYEDCESEDHIYRPATFCYQIKACNVVGCSGFSNIECVDVNTA